MRVAGAATTWPCDLGADRGRELGNADVLRALARSEPSGPHARELDRVALGAAGTLGAELGVRSRQWLEGADGSHLALHAGARALERARLRASDVDLLLVATCTPPRISSSLAAAVGRGLGVDAQCVDVRAGGAGGLVAWQTAASAIATGARNALVVAVEVTSPYLDERSLPSALLWGDGAAALVLERSSDAGDAGDAGGLVGSIGGTVRYRGTPFTVPGPLPPVAGALADGAYAFQRPDGVYLDELASVWDHACRALVALTPDVPGGLAGFLPYPVTRAQLARAAACVGAPVDDALAHLERRGSVGCAGALAVFAERVEAGVDPGGLWALCAVGGGISWCSLVWRT
jgi:3-oxoacyl-[acyl-carrier-protein] synthase-3